MNVHTHTQLPLMMRVAAMKKMMSGELEMDQMPPEGFEKDFTFETYLQFESNVIGLVLPVGTPWVASHSFIPFSSIPPHTRVRFA